MELLPNFTINRTPSKYLIVGESKTGRTSLVKHFISNIKPYTTFIFTTKKNEWLWKPFYINVFTNITNLQTYINIWKKIKSNRNRDVVFVFDSINWNNIELSQTWINFFHSSDMNVNIMIITNPNDDYPNFPEYCCSAFNYIILSSSLPEEKSLEYYDKYYFGYNTHEEFQNMNNNMIENYFFVYNQQENIKYKYTIV